MPYRLISTEMWSDPWFDELSPSEKLLFIYLFSNHSCNQAGVITQFSARRVAFETGIAREEIERIMTSFEQAGKVVSDGSRVACVAFLDHQVRNGNFAISAMKALDTLPEGKMKQVLSNRKATPKQHESNRKATPKQHESNASTVTGTGTDTEKSLACSKKTEQAGNAFFDLLKNENRFPGIDLDEQRRKMENWLLSNPKRKMTKKFIISWLSKEKPTKAQAKPTRIANTFED